MNKIYKFRAKIMDVIKEIETKFISIKFPKKLKKKTCPGPYCKNISLNNSNPLS
jgi:hypothetical protein